uniref:Uncharacterized protein n=1 Tax=Quercus lobata TaxID=97700 RepID=A0A7N2LSE7_QUELO
MPLDFVLKVISLPNILKYVGRIGSVIPTALLAGTEISVKEIQSAAAFSDHYLHSICIVLVSSPKLDPNVFVCQGLKSSMPSWILRKLKVLRTWISSKLYSNAKWEFTGV